MRERKFSPVIRLAAISLFVFLSAGCSRMEKIGVLASLGKDTEAQGRLVAQETENYERLCRDLREGKVPEGVSVAAFEGRYGAPVIKDVEEGNEVMAYKHGDKTWFHSEHIDVRFDASGRLISADSKSPDCSPSR
ncbi:MAG: hypothetical protein WCU74_07955 [Candidatus Omnitrophota bacterium]|jgi:hypothetical protein